MPECLQLITLLTLLCFGVTMLKFWFNLLIFWINKTELPSLFCALGTLNWVYFENVYSVQQNKNKNKEFIF